MLRAAQTASAYRATFAVLIGDDAIETLAEDLYKEPIMDASRRKELDEHCVASKVMVLFEGAHHKIVMEAVVGNDAAVLHLFEAIEMTMASEFDTAQRITCLR